MKFEQQVLWTVLPAGVTADGTQLKVSVFVTPRLGVPDPDPAQPPDRPERGTLRSFPDFCAWPDRLREATFEFGPGDGTSPSFSDQVRPSGPAPDPALWAKLFGGEDIPLEPYVFQDMAPRTHEARTYSARSVSKATRTAYGWAARESPEQPPEMRPMMREMMNTEDPGISSQATTMREGLNQVREFHEPLGRNTPTLADGETPPPPPPKKLDPDFHQMITSLGDHPALLRRLGLILDFLLPDGIVPESSGERTLSVVPHWTSELGPRSKDLAPRTRYVRLPDRKLFVPASRKAGTGPLGSPALGLLALPEDDFSLEQADIDSAALKLAELARDPAETGAAATDPAEPAPETKGLAPVRTQGLSLVRDKRLELLEDDFKKAAQDNDAAAGALARRQAGDAPHPERPDSADMPDLSAEDLVRGHRMDVWDDTRGRWYSLHARTVAYRSPGVGEPLLTASDEGFFQINLVSPPDDADSDRMYVPERITTWENWSLSAPRPGRVLGIGQGAPDEVVEPANERQTRLPLEIDVKVLEGSLPRLRYGRGYRIRLRTVDLAGNGLGLREADALMDRDHDGDWALPGDGPLLFRRFESVPAPAVVPRLPLDEGASVSRLVIRSTPGSAPGPAGGAAPGTGTRTVVLADVQPGMTNDDVRLVQQALIARGHPIPAGATGHFGSQTGEAYAAEQREQGFRGRDADGVPGCRSLTELGRNSGFAVDCDTAAGTPGTAARRPPGDEEPARTAEQYAAALNASPLVTTGEHTPFHGVDERHLVAPKASLQCVERHGLLDGAIGSQDHAAREAGYELASRENGSLGDPNRPDVEVTPVDSPAADPEHPAVTVRHTGEQVELPYLPEPLATGVLLFDLPGMPKGKPFEVGWGGGVWHRPLSFRLRLAEGDAPPRFDESSRVLTVSLPKAQVATVRVCSAVRFDESLMGLASWCREQPGPRPAPQAAPEAGERAARQDAEVRERASTALEMAAAGRHWMFTPGQELTLVHAVQRPLRQPVLELRPTGRRPENATAEHLAGTIRLDQGSTDRVELVARWTDVVDEGDEGRAERPMTTPVFDLLTAKLAPADGGAGAAPATLQDGTLTFSTQASDSPTAERPGSTEPKKHEFGDTKHRRVLYHPVAGTRFGEYFPSRLAEGDAGARTVRGAAVEHSVPSSARPTAPRVLYCVPTLSLETVEGPPGTVVRRRRGGGIRVFLQRPWFSSGDGELLGVVLGPAAGAGTPAPNAPEVTLMGRDPVHRSAEVLPPTVSTFTNAVRHAEGVTPATPTQPPTVTVVGFTPQFDAEGDRWFCDLDLDTGDTCLPFIRLALVRYQPNSIPGAEISPVVVTDLVRTLPDRELRVKLDDMPTVSVTGPSYDPSDSPPPRVTATVQRRNDAVTDEDLAWVTLHDTTVTLTSIDAASTRTPSYIGQVPLPEGARRDRLRLLVMETDGIPPDAGTPPTTPGPVVYCDTVPLDGDHRRRDHHDGRDHDGRDHRRGDHDRRH
ncbi:peptidoglycan-binding protein [Streptomyces sp. 13-12-16]|uniref:peptidoglycan-binding domain-containing protein n=1 Tax=Streptomyces sp. 13-12-16 TaxID=1570823 RepID=UPI00117C3517|nr:peptidoglycan-binding domain-containing protein [Streptomyces sp. 13-12-16]